MSEEAKKIEKMEQEVKPAELSEQELDNVAGGGANKPIGNAGVGLGHKTGMNAD